MGEPRQTAGFPVVALLGMDVDISTVGLSAIVRAKLPPLIFPHLFSTDTVYVFASSLDTFAKLRVDEVAPATTPVLVLHSYLSVPPPFVLATMLAEAG